MQASAARWGTHDRILEVLAARARNGRMVSVQHACRAPVSWPVALRPPSAAPRWVSLLGKAPFVCAIFFLECEEKQIEVRGLALRRFCQPSAAEASLRGNTLRSRRPPCAGDRQVSARAATRRRAQGASPGRPASARAAVPPAPPARAPAPRAAVRRARPRLGKFASVGGRAQHVGRRAQGQGQRGVRGQELRRGHRLFLAGHRPRRQQPRAVFQPLGLLRRAAGSPATPRRRASCYRSRRCAPARARGACIVQGSAVPIRARRAARGQLHGVV